MSELTEKCTLARDAAQKLLSVSTAVKDRALDAIADALVERTDEIIAANELDLKNAEENGLRKSMMDRLRLTPERIKGIADGSARGQGASRSHRRGYGHVDASERSADRQKARADGRYRYYL